MRNIAMTGGIASGKNTAASIFEELGCYTIDSDLISKQIMVPGEECYENIVSNFGTDILDENKLIIRKKLGSIIFNNPNKKELLESIVHPAIFKKQKQIRSEIFGKNSKAIVITHAALMIESGSYKEYDSLIVVTASRDVRIKRIIERDNVDFEYAEKVISNQMSDEERLSHAKFIIDNSSNRENLYNEVKRVYELINLLNYGIKNSK